MSINKNLGFQFLVLVFDFSISNEQNKNLAILRQSTIQNIQQNFVGVLKSSEYRSSHRIWFETATIPIPTGLFCARFFLMCLLRIYELYQLDTSQKSPLCDKYHLIEAETYIIEIGKYFINCNSHRVSIQSNLYSR